MDLINISTNWLCEKPINSCLFVRDLGPVISGHTSNLESKEDIELLLESYENCVQLYEPKENNEDSILSCKLLISTKTDNNSDITESIEAKVDSFSILCSAKAIELHGNHNEYKTTLSNEFIDETDGLSMFRNDYQFNEPQEEVSLTFKGFDNELWIYALLINIRKIKSTNISSNSGSNISSIMNLMSMFGKNIKGIGSESKQHLITTSLSQQQNCLINKFSQLMGSKESENFTKNNSIEEKDFINDSNKSSNIDVMSSSAQSMETSNNSSDTKSEDISRSGDLCECDCHQKCVSHQNSSELKELRQYIDNKFSDLETIIDNKFCSLENKMTQFLSLYLNK